MSATYIVASVEKILLKYLREMTHIPESEEETFLADLKNELGISEEEIE